MRFPLNFGFNLGTLRKDEVQEIPRVLPLVNFSCNPQNSALSEECLGESVSEFTYIEAATIYSNKTLP